MNNAAMQDLVKQAQGGDREAFGTIYEQLAPRIYGYLYHHTGGRAQLAEDLSEDVFVKVLQRLTKYQDRGLPFAAWVFRIAHNIQVDHFRVQPKQGLVSLEDCNSLSEGQAEKDLDDTLTRGLLTEALQQLTEDQRQVVVFRYLQGLSILETGAAVGKSSDAVKKLQARALMSLRRVLGGRAVVAQLAA